MVAIVIRKIVIIAIVISFIITVLCHLTSQATSRHKLLRPKHYIDETLMKYQSAS